MILKKKDGTAPSGKLQKAGYEAEKQMAYYLQRAFAESPDVFVFNDLRFVRNEVVAQIDHLVLHRYGLCLVESKSVTGSIEVNKQLEFVRVYAGKRSGMMSPISQVQMQKALLQSLLNDHREELREKVLLGMKQPSFFDERFDTLVAVSDRGEINRRGCDPPELVKADQVASAIARRIASRDRAQGVGGAVRSILADKKTRKQMEEDYLPVLTDNELQSIQAFLTRNHRPGVAASPVVREPAEAFSATPPPVSPGPATPPPASPRPATLPAASASAVTRAKAPEPEGLRVASSAAACQHCRGEDLEVAYGKYGYYFRCRTCAKNTKIDFSCPKCGVRAKISKKAERFSWKCAECGNDSHFFTNPGLHAQ